MIDEEASAEDNTETVDEQTTMLSENEDGKQDDDSSSSDKDAAASAGETKKGDDKAADDDGDAAKSKDAKGDEEDSDDDKAEVISYDEINIPEGMDVDEKALGSFKELAAGMNDGKGLSNEDAQSLVDFRAEMVKSQMTEWETTFSEWRGEIQTDKELGGDLFEKKTIPNVLAAAEKYGGPDFVRLIKTNKMYGENPLLIRLLNRVGAPLAEDQIGKGRKVSSDKDAAEILYPEKGKE